jgi:hypothetical protein
MHGFFGEENRPGLLAWNHDPQQEIDQQAWYAAWNKRNDHREAKPERADPKEFGEAATNAGQHTISS